MFTGGARTGSGVVAHAAISAADNDVGVIGVSLNRWVMVLQVLAVPVMPFIKWILYYPSWQEIVVTLMIICAEIWILRWMVTRMPVLNADH